MIVLKVLVLTHTRSKEDTGDLVTETHNEFTHPVSSPWAVHRLIEVGLSHRPKHRPVNSLRDFNVHNFNVLYNEFLFWLLSIYWRLRSKQPTIIY